MPPDWPPAAGEPPARALYRCAPEDFLVEELAGFELSGDGEHAFLLLEKRALNTADAVSRLCELAGVSPRDVGFAGMKDRNAIARQWFSVGLAGRGEPDWAELERSGDLRVLSVGRHRRKLRRGSHAGNRFRLRLRRLRGDRAALTRRLAQLHDVGAPNYFGEQRFGNRGSTLAAARRWVHGGTRVSRKKRGLYLSALRAALFNELLAQRVRAGTWNQIQAAEVCMLDGSNSYFLSREVDDDLRQRTRLGDVHPGLPLWGAAGRDSAAELLPRYAQLLEDYSAERAFLEGEGLQLAWRAARLIPDDFSWQFCDDDALQLDFALSVGSYATALLAECVDVENGGAMGGNGREQG